MEGQCRCKTGSPHCQLIRRVFNLQSKRVLPEIQVFSSLNFILSNNLRARRFAGA